MVLKLSKSLLLILCVPMLSMAADFQYDNPGKLVPGSGTGNTTTKVYLPNMRFPIEKAPAYANTQVHAPGGYILGGSQCAAQNYSYPWRDNFCETRSRSTSIDCATSRAHQGQDIRPSSCKKDVHWTVAAEAGTITNIGKYSVSLTGDSGVRHRYLHINMNRLAVKDNQRVSKGQKIGLVSNFFGGTATTIHLHYDIYLGGKYRSTYMTLVNSYEALLGKDPSGPGNPPPSDSNTYKTAVTASGADFNGDGADDIYWYRYGAAADYLWSGQQDRSFSSRRQDSGGDFTPIAGDFNGDGLSDIFWYRSGQEYDYLWLSQGSGFTAVRHQISGDYLPISGDFDGNGVDDIFWYKPGSGQDVVFYGNTSGQFNAISATVNDTYTPVAADFDGNGTDEIFWFGAGSATDYIWKGRGTGFVRSPIQVTESYNPISGDFNGDGRGDIFWYAAGAAADYISYSDGSGFTYAPKNAVPIIGSYTPVKGDFDGDGYSDIFWFKPLTAGDDWLYYGTAQHQFTPVKQSVASTYIPVP